MGDRPKSYRRGTRREELVAFLDAQPLIDRAAADLEELDRLVEESPDLLDAIRQKHVEMRARFPDAKVIRTLSRLPDSFGRAAVFSYSRSGFVREAAIVSLARLGERSLPYLLLRCCDWVKPVAARAERGVATILVDRASNTTLKRCLRVLPVMNHYGHLAWWPAAGVLRALSTRPSLLESIRWRIPTHVIEFLLDHRLLGAGEQWLDVVRAGLGQPHPRVVGRVVRAMAQLTAEERTGLLPELLSSRTRAARLEAVELAAALGLRDVLKSLSVDRIWRVRANARYNLERLGGSNFANHYRHQFPAAGAIAGFGEVASDAELSELVPYLAHALAGVRQEAARAIGNREYREATQDLVARLSDERASVIRAAARALRQLGHRLSGASLAEVFIRSEDPKQLRALMTALDLVSRWESLRLALELLNRNILVGDINPMLNRWLAAARRDVAGPSPAELEAVRSAFAQAGGQLAEPVRLSLRRELDYWTERRK